MTEELGQIFETLSKPNPEKKTDTHKNNSECKNASWYNISLDNGSPEYTLDPNTHKWIPYREQNTSAVSKPSKSVPKTRASSESKADRKPRKEEAPIKSKVSKVSKPGLLSKK